MCSHIGGALGSACGHATLDILQIRTPILEESNDISFGLYESLYFVLDYTISFKSIPKNKHLKMSV